MFTKSAEFYDKIYSIKDYAQAAGKIRQIVRVRAPGARSLLDVGCGTGKHISYLQDEYSVTGLDIGEELIGVARRLHPDIPFHIADMGDFDLHETYDVVTCLFSAIGYVKTLDRLEATLHHIAAHTRPGGVVLVEPWFTPETYWVDHITANFLDEKNLKIVWMYVSRREDFLSILDIHYMVGTPEGVVEFTERHEIGLFTHEQYENAFREAGLTVEYDAEGLFQRGLYIGRKLDR